MTAYYDSLVLRVLDALEDLPLAQSSSAIDALAALEAEHSRVVAELSSGFAESIEARTK